MKRSARQTEISPDNKRLAQSIEKGVAILQAQAAISKAQMTLIAAGIRDYDEGCLVLRALMDEEYRLHEATIKECTAKLHRGSA